MSSGSVMPDDGALRERIRQALWLDERHCIAERLRQARAGTAQEAKVQEVAFRLAEAGRKGMHQQAGLSAFMREYDLSSQEGVLLMCLAEALLRVPDADTADRLIRDRLAKGRWSEHLGSSSSLLVNASSWGLLISGRLLASAGVDTENPEQMLARLFARVGEHLLRLAMQQAMQMLARQFVLGRDIGEALVRSEQDDRRLRYSFDCLGEAAHTQGDAERYFIAYQDAIEQVGAAAGPDTGAFPDRPGISIKLSALHPRYEYAQRERVFDELLPRLQRLVELAASMNISITLDAEEADRLELSLDIFAHLLDRLSYPDWQGLGLAVQAYQKRALPVLQWLLSLAEHHQRRIPIRLVKGAYWDSEIKRAQELGLPAYPVFTRKAATDVSYLACARFLLANSTAFYPQFASHNAFTLAWVMVLGQQSDFELQRLHGMGDALFEALDSGQVRVPPVRVYAPVGSHTELLPYLVRRLLENGANSSFINQLTDEQTPLEVLVENPCDHMQALDCAPHTRIPLPPDLYADERRNSLGYDFSDPPTVAALSAQVDAEIGQPWQASALVEGDAEGDETRSVFSPANYGRSLGNVREASPRQVEQALASTAAGALEWDARGGAGRAQCLRAAADLFEAQAPALVARIVMEGGRTMADAVSEVREAVDFCRYYARRAELEFERPQYLPGPTGEHNELQLHGRGVFACISPWNFPLAIFTGQVVAALAAGNAVLAKPASQTTLTGFLAVELLHQAGVPRDVLCFLPGSGRLIGEKLFADSRLGGVAFTGSTETAWSIQRALAARQGPIVPLIAETGGQNVMIADSSALPEQLVVDVIRSAFNSAGQRCSALRVLFVQEDIADAFICLLQGAMAELQIGDPRRLDTDIGPLIDARAVADLSQHAQRMHREATLLKQVAVPESLANGSFFSPLVYELDNLSQLNGEIFGPVLHLIRFQGDRLDAVVDALNSTGYGLTLGVHSRIESTWQRVKARARVGNLYINRNMIGAVVGVQPFGGEGLSGTGPKAGGPYYLHRFALERTRSVNTAALGGNASLLSLSDDS